MPRPTVSCPPARAVHAVARGDLAADAVLPGAFALAGRGIVPRAGRTAAVAGGCALADRRGVTRCRPVGRGLRVLLRLPLDQVELPRRPALVVIVAAERDQV